MPADSFPKTKTLLLRPSDPFDFRKNPANVIYSKTECSRSPAFKLRSIASSSVKDLRH